MTYLHDAKKAKSYASKAYEKIQEKGIAPTPEAFELWYVYFSGENLEVSHAIDQLLQSSKKITGEQCVQLYQQFIRENTDSEKVKAASDRVQATISEIDSVFNEVTQKTTQYNGSLEQASADLEKHLSADEVKSIVANMRSGTKEILQTNETLSQELKRSARTMEAMKKDMELIRKEALTDGLTSVGNRKAFDQEILRIAAEAKETKKPFALILLDIDHFKNFNDTFGHMVGDQVLKLVAKTLTDGVKGRDIVSRYGGEEFAILLPDTNSQGAFLVADKLRKDVESKKIINKNTGKPMAEITISGGVAEFAKTENIEALITRADEALYKSKNKGRNQISHADAPKVT